MFKKQILLSLLFTILIMPGVMHAYSTGEKWDALYYGKLGMVSPPAEDRDILPNIGIGARVKRGEIGFDVSINAASLIFVDYCSLKWLVLYYPQLKSRFPIYVGLGAGLGFHSETAILGAPWGGVSSERSLVTLEGVIGYEVKRYGRCKPFVQLEWSQSLSSLNGHCHNRKWMPGLAIVGGIGF